MHTLGCSVARLTGVDHDDGPTDPAQRHRATQTRWPTADYRYVIRPDWLSNTRSPPPRPCTHGAMLRNNDCQVGKHRRSHRRKRIALSPLRHLRLGLFAIVPKAKATESDAERMAMTASVVRLPYATTESCRTSAALDTSSPGRVNASRLASK